MKTFANKKITVTGNKFTMTADIVEKDYSAFPVQQQTIVHMAKNNVRHHRHIQISMVAAFVKTPGKKIGFALENQDLVNLATQVEPLLSYAPVAANKLDKTLTVKIHSELTPDLQWQTSADGTTWTDVAGQTTNTLDKATVKAGSQVRLKASSNAGEMFTNAVTI